MEDELELVITVALVSAQPFFLGLVACVSLRGLLTSSEHILF